ncbi:MAG: hypothetical protein FJ220_03205 [Kiritimatiellaceae bacterium]|nr:hypothetical protein [Kiritimatiellaceae bacterium]
MKKRVINAVLCISAILLMGAVAVETVDQLYIQPRTISSWGELVEEYLDFRETYGPIAPPVDYAEAVAGVEKSDWSFLANSWSFIFSDGTYYVPKTSKLAKLKLPLQIRIYEDLKRGEMIVLSSSDGKNFQGEALFKSPVLMPYEKDVPLNRYASDELAPRRVVLEVTLKPEADAWTDLASLRTEDVATMGLLSGDEMMAMMSVPEEHTNELWLCLEPQVDSGINLNIFVPEGFTNRVELYSCPDLVSNLWTVVEQNLLRSGTNPIVWPADESEVRFYAAGNMDIDSDLDSLPDARELIVHKTDPTEADSDMDTISDYQELYASYTDPNNNDIAPPSVWISVPGFRERKVILP